MIVYNKLVRDRIPEIINNAGKKYVIKELSEGDYAKALESKLSEELNEYLASGNVEELADLLEVVHAILRNKGLTPTDLESIREKKLLIRGGFNKRIKLVSVEEGENR